MVAKNPKSGITTFKLGILVVSLALVLFLSVPSLREGAVESLSAIYASVLVNLTNKERALNKANELKVNELLIKAAQMKADDMASKSYFAHNSPDGKTPWYWFMEVGYNYRYAGENLAVNFSDSEEVQRAWTNSRGHFLNIINPKYTEIGIATSTGIYKGREAVFVVQMFGTPIKQQNN
jgi:uncharacterized protein YkwD